MYLRYLLSSIIGPSVCFDNGNTMKLPICKKRNLMTKDNITVALGSIEMSNLKWLMRLNFYFLRIIWELSLSINSSSLPSLPPPKKIPYSWLSKRCKLHMLIGGYSGINGRKASLLRICYNRPPKRIPLFKLQLNWRDTSVQPLEVMNSLAFLKDQTCFLNLALPLKIL